MMRKCENATEPWNQALLSSEGMRAVRRLPAPEQGCCPEGKTSVGVGDL